MRIQRAGLVLLFCTSFAVADGAKVAGVQFPSVNAHSGSELPLRGAGLLTWFFIKAYASTAEWQFAAAVGVYGRELHARDFGAVGDGKGCAKQQDETSTLYSHGEAPVLPAS